MDTKQIYLFVFNIISFNFWRLCILLKKRIEKWQRLFAKLSLHTIIVSIFMRSINNVKVSVTGQFQEDKCDKCSVNGRTIYSVYVSRICRKFSHRLARRHMYIKILEHFTATFFHKFSFFVRPKEYFGQFLELFLCQPYFEHSLLLNLKKRMISLLKWLLVSFIVIKAVKEGKKKKRQMNSFIEKTIEICRNEMMSR